MAAHAEHYRRPLLLWGGTVGFGLGAVVDVVLFHLVLQHHHLLSGYIDPGTRAGLSANLVYDGLFTAAMLAVAVLGGAMLWRTANRASVRLSAGYLAGGVLVGAGLFNVFDGTVNHYVLGLHDVVHGTEAWNPHWVGASLALLGLGLGVALLYRTGGPVRDEPTARGPESESQSGPRHDE